jgi:hypothetical protein
MMRNFLLALFAVIISAALIFPQAVTITTDRSPNHDKYQPGDGTRSMWDLELTFNLNTATGAAGNAGAEFDGTYFYCTRWASNLIFKFDMTGNMIESFSIPGVTGLRDLAFDGTYMYGGAAANTIYQMDFVSKTLVGTISSPVAVRYIAYDEDNDAFWCGTWADNPTLVSRTGQNLGSFSTGLSSQYGAAYDNISAGGPYLWIFDQGGGACPGSLMIYQFEIATGTPTGVSHDACADLTDGIAGGLFSTIDFVAGIFSIGGVMQSNSGLDDTYFVYEIGPAVIVGPGVATDPFPANGATDVDINQDISWTNPAGATSIEVFFGTSGNMNSVYSGAPISTFDPGTLSYYTAYSWKINETDGTGTTSGPTWSFVTMQDPNLVTIYMDDFESGLGNYTVNTTGGCPWQIFTDPSITGRYTLPATAGGGILAADADHCGSSGGGSSGSVTLNSPIDATNYPNVAVEWDNDWYPISSSDFAYLDVSVDGGATWMNVVTFGVTGVRNTHEYHDISSMVGGQSFIFRLVSVQPGWDWWWALDNLQFTGWGAGNNYVFQDNFDSYVAGQQLACQNPADWTTWNLNPCDAVTDAYISSNFAHSAPNSFVVVLNNDEVHPIANFTSGMYEVGFYNYIPTGKTGYFNTLALFDGNNSQWGLEVYFNAGGAGSINAGGVGSATFTYLFDTWVLNQVVVDLDNDLAQYWYNGSMVYEWQWTLGSNGTPISLQLGGNDFYGAAATDEMYVDDYYINNIIPVEFTSFQANTKDGTVVLNWTTATETNNSGFEVQRSNGQEYMTLGFVNGNGTSTQPHSYSYVDNTVTPGTYSYRLRQVDFDGSSAYSNVVEVIVEMPSIYSLAQNYPNPFNPSTQINFSLAADSKVTLKIFDILGQEVTTLINGNLLAGSHFAVFNASSLTSGVYLYKLEAKGADGSSFTSVKKMILTK